MPHAALPVQELTLHRTLALPSGVEATCCAFLPCCNALLIGCWQDSLPLLDLGSFQVGGYCWKAGAAWAGLLPPGGTWGPGRI
jgi:hypothetical protein